MHVNFTFQNEFLAVTIPLQVLSYLFIGLLIAERLWEEGSIILRGNYNKKTGVYINFIHMIECYNVFSSFEELSGFHWAHDIFTLSLFLVVGLHSQLCAINWLQLLLCTSGWRFLIYGGLWWKSQSHKKTQNQMEVETVNNFQLLENWWIRRRY